MLDKTAILRASDTRIEQVDVPEWGGHVFVRTLPAMDLDDFEGENYIVKGKSVEMNRRNYRARLLIRAICDEKGEPVFTLKDVDALGKKSGAAVNRVFLVAQRLNGLGGDDLELATKNSESGQGDSSISPLPASSE